MMMATRSGQHLGDIGIGCKEIVEDAAYLLLRLNADHGFELSRLDGDVARMLRVEDSAIEHGGLVVAAVVVLQLGLYLALLELLLQEPGELRQLGVVGQLRHIYVSKIELVGNHQRLLLMHAGLAGDSADKQIVAVGRLLAAG